MDCVYSHIGMLYSNGNEWCVATCSSGDEFHKYIEWNKAD